MLNKTYKHDIISHLFNKKGLKSQYKCLPYMITLPLITFPGLPPYQPDVLYNRIILQSTSSTNGYLNYTVLQPGDLTSTNTIIHVNNQVLMINKFNYNFDIDVNIISKGIDDVPLRFMSDYPGTNPTLATNMNDFKGNETVFKNNHIKFSMVGDYQRFFIHYPTSGFNMIITITTSYKKPCKMICCTKRCAFLKKCTCFEEDNRGYIEICKKNVPVYIKRCENGAIVTDLYPNFAYLRNLFYNITIGNSLTPPLQLLNVEVEISVVLNVLGSYNTDLKFDQSINPIIRVLSENGGDQYNQLNILDENATYTFSWDTVNYGPAYSSTGIDFYIRQSAIRLLAFQFDKWVLVNYQNFSTTNDEILLEKNSFSYYGVDTYLKFQYGLLTNQLNAVADIIYNKQFNITVTKDT